MNPRIALLIAVIIVFFGTAVTILYDRNEAHSISAIGPEEQTEESHLTKQGEDSELSSPSKTDVPAEPMSEDSAAPPNHWLIRSRFDLDPLAEYKLRLEKAIEGDKSQQFAVGMLALLCANAPKDRDRMESLISLNHYPDAMANEMRRRQSQCAPLSALIQDEWEEYEYWIAESLKNGSALAKLFSVSFQDAPEKDRSVLEQLVINSLDESGKDQFLLMRATGYALSFYNRYHEWDYINLSAWELVHCRVSFFCDSSIRVNRLKEHAVHDINEIYSKANSYEAMILSGTQIDSISMQE